MTVSELIDLLLKQDAKAEVKVFYLDFGDDNHTEEWLYPTEVRSGVRETNRAGVREKESVVILDCAFD